MQQILAKRLLPLFIILGLPALLFAQTTKTAKPATKPALATTGYNIVCSIKPYNFKQTLYLAYYYGSIKGMADSATIDATGKATFRGKTQLQQGIYILASPEKTILFEMLIGADQDFSISADTTNINGTLVFKGSSENEHFLAYTKFINPLAIAAEDARKKSAVTTDPIEKARLDAIVNNSVKSIEDYRAETLKKYPNDMLSVLFKSMQDVKLPTTLQNPKTHADSLEQYRWGKTHYWDGVDFMDGRLVRTPILENKLKNYLNNWVVPEADSIIYEFNWMIALGRNDPEMFKYLIGYYVDNYMYPKIMGQDKVFLYVYERYLSSDKPKVDWLNEKQMKTINERAMMLMANQLGTQAWNMELADTVGKIKALYDIKANYTIVAFWDVHCGKCREEIPKMDTLFQTKWKDHNVQVYAVMVNEESEKEWPAFINEHCHDWVHVHQSAEMRAAEEKAGKPNFRQLYDMRSTPTLFLLDGDKRILAKNIGLTDLDKVLEQRFKDGK